MFFYFLLSALVPVVFFCFFIYLRDTEKEPISVLVKCFLFGALIIIPTVIIELILMNRLDASGLTGMTKNLIDAFGVTAVVEEGMKLLALLLFLRKNRFFDQHYDGIVYAAFVSLGFASVENIFYILDSGFTTAIVRAFMAIPAHMFFAVFMGYYLSLAFLGDQNRKKRNLWLAFIVPVVIHGLYDFFLFELERAPFVYFLLVFVLCLGMWKYGLRKIKKMTAYDLRDAENEAGQETGSV